MSFEIILIVFATVSILIGINSNNNYKWTFFGMGAAIISLGLVTLSSNSFGWKLLVWLTLGFMVIILAYVVILIILKIRGIHSIMFVIILIYYHLVP